MSTRATGPTPGHHSVGQQLCFQSRERGSLLSFPRDLSEPQTRWTQRSPHPRPQFLASAAHRSAIGQFSPSAIGAGIEHAGGSEALLVLGSAALPALCHPGAFRGQGTGDGRWQSFGGSTGYLRKGLKAMAQGREAQGREPGWAGGKERV